MKKIHTSKKINLFLQIFLVSYLFLFNSACGLDEFPVINEPKTIENQPNYDSLFDGKCFIFFTNENEGDSGFLGTEVYYRIYNNKYDMGLEQNELENIAIDDDKKSNSYDRMIALGYQKLVCEGTEANSYLIPSKKNKTSQKVYIRLTDYLDLPEYSARIEVDGEIKGKPVRFQDNYTFNFGNSGTNDLIPTNADKDCKISSSASSAGVWYVSMFAVGVTQNTELRHFWSNILYLGTVSIVENSNSN